MRARVRTDLESGSADFLRIVQLYGVCRWGVFFAPTGSYTDVAMDSTYVGHDEIARFHRWMRKFAPDSVIEFSQQCASDGLLYLEWIWSGSFAGSLKLPGGNTFTATGQRFSVPGGGGVSVRRGRQSAQPSGLLGREHHA
jgi:hypothetical protein